MIQALARLKAVAALTVDQFEKDINAQKKALLREVADIDAAVSAANGLGKFLKSKKVPLQESRQKPAGSPVVGWVVTGDGGATIALVAAYLKDQGFTVRDGGTNAELKLTSKKLFFTAGFDKKADETLFKLSYF